MFSKRRVKSGCSLAAAPKNGPKQGMDTFSEEATPSKLFCIPSEKGSTLKGKNLLPMGANSFLLE